ncbi:hypothetical protein FLP41_15775 [Paracoccus marcusii]|uniref:hypothetical protein n=1 Tax=Paracoccus marcusii TaxID=59779 RepID=UPI002ECFE7A0|nr:hypothetical protein FLP41_15775 [Paracoccus marcusii]
MLDWLAPRVAGYKQPKKLLIWDALPKSAYGKVTRKMIRDELIACNQWQQAVC